MCGPFITFARFHLNSMTFLSLRRQLIGARPPQLRVDRMRRPRGTRTYLRDYQGSFITDYSVGGANRTAVGPSFLVSVGRIAANRLPTNVKIPFNSIEKPKRRYVSATTKNIEPDPERKRRLLEPGEVDGRESTSSIAAFSSEQLFAHEKRAAKVCALRARRALLV